MYFCKSCGEAYMTDEAVLCVKCGTARGQGTNFCHYCGKLLAPGAEICMNCGVSIKTAGSNTAKSKGLAGVLGIFCGGIGMHNFYLGYMWKGMTQLLATIVGVMSSFFFLAIGKQPLIAVGIMFCTSCVWMWTLVEAILILTGRIDRDADGVPLGE